MGTPRMSGKPQDRADGCVEGVEDLFNWAVQVLVRGIEIILMSDQGPPGPRSGGSSPRSGSSGSSTPRTGPVLLQHGDEAKTSISPMSQLQDGSAEERIETLLHDGLETLARAYEVHTEKRIVAGEDPGPRVRPRVRTDPASRPALWVPPGASLALGDALSSHDDVEELLRGSLDVLARAIRTRASDEASGTRLRLSARSVGLWAAPGPSLTLDADVDVSVETVQMVLERGLEQLAREYSAGDNAASLRPQEIMGSQWQTSRPAVWVAAGPSLALSEATEEDVDDDFRQGLARLAEPYRARLSSAAAATVVEDPAALLRPRHADPSSQPALWLSPGPSLALVASAGAGSDSESFSSNSSDSSSSDEGGELAREALVPEPSTNGHSSPSPMPPLALMAATSVSPDPASPLTSPRLTAQSSPRAASAA